MPLPISIPPPELEAVIDPATGRITYRPKDVGRAASAPSFQGLGLPQALQGAAQSVPSTPVVLHGNASVSGGPTPLEALGATNIPFQAAGDAAYSASGSPLVGAATQALAGVATPGAIGRAGRYVGKAAADVLPGALEGLAGKMGAGPLYAVKPRGGQWIEPDLGSLMYDVANQEAQIPRNQATPLSTYIDKNLRRWIKTSMGTTETDDLAKELGIDYQPYGRHLPGAEGRYFHPVFGGATEHANPFDDVVDVGSAGEHSGRQLFFDLPHTEQSEWLKRYHADPEVLAGGLKLSPQDYYAQKTGATPKGWLGTVDPSTPVYSLVNDLNLPEPITQMMDYLRTVPPEKLKSIAVPDALRQSKAYHDALAKKQTDAALSAGSLVTHREYPDSGFKWQEIVEPTELPPGYTARQIPNTDMHAAALKVKHQILNPAGEVIGEGYNPDRAVELAKMKLLAQGLDAEGQMMGHCVGSYCDQVSGGGTRIFSLRDPTGKPHVTVEVAPGKNLTAQDLPDDVRDHLAEQYGDASREEFEAAVQRNVDARKIPASIKQIKGKQNAAPVEQYLPYVQDFVKNSPLGSQWGHVGDLGNAGLVRPRDQVNPDLFRRATGLDPESFITADEWKQHYKRIGGPKSAYYEPPEEGHAAGGPVVDPLRKEWDAGEAYRAAQRGLADSKTGTHASVPSADERFAAWKAAHPSVAGGAPNPDDGSGLDELARSGQMLAHYAGGGHVSPARVEDLVNWLNAA